MRQMRIHRKEKRRRSTLDRAIMCFLGLFLFFIIVGVTVLFTIVMGSKFGDGSFYSIKGFNSNTNHTNHMRKAVKTHPTIGYSFDGNTYIESSAVMDYYSQTVSIWFYITNPGKRGKRTLLSNRDSRCGVTYGESNTNGYGFYIDIVSAEEQYIVVLYSNGEDACKEFSVPVDADISQWSHLAVVFKRTNSKTRGIRYPMKLDVYINGDHIRSTNDVRYLQSSVSFFIGSFANARSPFVGTIASVMIYNAALPSSQIADLAKYIPIQQDSERLFIKLRPEVLSEKIGNTVHLLGTSTITRQDMGEEEEEENEPVRTSVKEDEEDDEEDKTPQIDFDHVIVDNSKRMKTRLRDAKSDLDLFKQSLHQKDTSFLRAGTYHFSLPSTLTKKYQLLNSGRAAAVKRSMQHLWKGYRQRAFGHDELKPVSGGFDDNWGGVGLTLIDSLDTLYLLGFRSEFDEAAKWVVNNFTLNAAKEVSVFEFNIRLLGGLLSAYELSGNEGLLRKAKEVGEVLKIAFTEDYILPASHVNPSKKEAGDSNKAMLAEFGSLSLEFRSLSRLTGDDSYATLVDGIYDYIASFNHTDGLFPLIDRVKNEPKGRHYSIGALGDSFYEYLLKAWIQGGKKETRLKELYDRSVDGMLKHLFEVSKLDRYMFIGEKRGTRKVKQMQHLTCFVGGMLALGSIHETDARRAARDLEKARGLAYTCYQMYKSTPTGLSPEYVTFADEKGMTPGLNGRRYLLRPEVVETFYILYTITKDPIYIEWGYDIFLAIESQCKTRYGYGEYPDVMTTKLLPEDKMESYFPAETLKYLYLLFNPEQVVDFNKVVFNTECHPLKIF